jgi:hypothetical protein
MISVKHQLTLQEFLTLPEEDITYELLNSEAEAKISPKSSVPFTFNHCLVSSSHPREVK